MGEREADVGLFQGSAVVGPVAAHADYLSKRLINTDNPRLIIRLSPSKNLDKLHQLAHFLPTLLKMMIENMIKRLARHTKLQAIPPDKLDNPRYIPKLLKLVLLKLLKLMFMEFLQYKMTLLPMADVSFLGGIENFTFEADRRGG